MNLDRILIACPAAILVVLAFWAALGNGSTWLRIFLLILVSVCMGTVMVLWSPYMLTSNAPAARNFEFWQRRQLWEVKYWWVAWYCLSTGLLASCLLFFRARGYRLARVSSRQIRR